MSMIIGLMQRGITINGWQWLDSKRSPYSRENEALLAPVVAYVQADVQALIGVWEWMETQFAD